MSFASLCKYTNKHLHETTSYKLTSCPLTDSLSHAALQYAVDLIPWGTGVSCTIEYRPESNQVLSHVVNNEPQRL